MRKNKKMILLIVLISMTLGATVGCVISKKNNDNNDIVKEDEKDQEISIAVGAKDYDILNRSENISNVVVELYGIDNASSIIFNDIVVIAVEMGVDNTFTDDIKEMIIDTVLSNDTMIRQVLITDDKKIFDQIESIIEGLMNGKPYDDYVKDINRIIEKLK